jgi:hypothetical protein
MDETILKLRILARAEVTLARVHGRVLARRLLLAALTVGAILLTVVMVNLGSFELLAERFGKGAAAFVVAGVNAALAVVLLLLAGRQRPCPEEQMVQDIRDLALAELSADAEAVRQGLDAVTSDLERIRTGIGALTGGAGAGLGNLAPVVGLLVEALKRRKA